MKRLELEAKKLSPLYQFAGKSKINLSRCSAIVKGRIPPNQREIGRIAQVLRISLEEVVSWSQEEI